MRLYWIVRIRWVNLLTEGLPPVLGSKPIFRHPLRLILNRDSISFLPLIFSKIPSLTSVFAISVISRGHKNLLSSHLQQKNSLLPRDPYWFSERTIVFLGKWINHYSTYCKFLVRGDSLYHGFFYIPFWCTVFLNYTKHYCNTPCIKLINDTSVLIC